MICTTNNHENNVKSHENTTHAASSVVDPRISAQTVAAHLTCECHAPPASCAQNVDEVFRYADRRHGFVGKARDWSVKPELVTALRRQGLFLKAVEDRVRSATSESSQSLRLICERLPSKAISIRGQP